MNHAPSSRLSVTEKNTGTIFPYLKGIFAFHVTVPNLAIWNVEVTSYSVDIVPIQIECCSFQTVAAVAWAIITKGFIPSKTIANC